MKHKTGTRKQWLAARLRLLEAEKELTRRGDDLARRRQASVGSDRKGVYFRDRQGPLLSGRPLPRALTTPHLSFHVWA